jgi:hypothetical protein
VDPYGGVFGPGLYSFVGEVKLSNDDIRSMQTVSEEATVAGDPLNGHVILFENANFRGQHVHIFQPEKDLSVLGFDNITSSIVVESGNWSFFFDHQFDGSYTRQPIFGLGSIHGSKLLASGTIPSHLFSRALRQQRTAMLLTTR